MKKQSIILVIFFSLYPMELRPQDNNTNCIENRYVFDIGSGATKARLVKYNTCNKKILHLGESVSEKLQYQMYIDKSSDRNSLNKEVMDKGVTVITSIEKQLNINCKVDKCIGIATAFMRNANNAQQFIDLIKKKKNINVHKILQSEEATLGYMGAVHEMKQNNVAKAKIENLVIWDMGGGSYQLSFAELSHLDNKCLAQKSTNTQSTLYNSSNDKNYNMYFTDYKEGKMRYDYEDFRLNIHNGRLGSESFKSIVIETIKNYSLDDIDTPNPMTEREVKKAIYLAQKIAGEAILSDDDISDKLQNKHTKIFAIGGLFNNIPLARDKENAISKEQIYNAIKELTLKSDDYIRDNHLTDKNAAQFSSNALTNYILIYGVLSVLDIDKFYISDSDNSIGIALSDKYWFQ